MITLDTQRTNNAAFHKLSNFRVESLLIQNTGTYENQFLRPYVTNNNLDNQTMSSLSTSILDKVSQAGKIDGYAMAGLGNNFLTRASDPESAAFIPNGWDTRRSQFIMKIVLVNSLGMSNPCFVTGYTDHAGINPQTKSIDPRMIFMVNSITQARVVNMRAPTGMIAHMSATGTQQLFVNTNDSSMNSNYGGGNDHQFVMRPDDVFRTIQNAPMYQSTDNPLNPGEINDTTIRLDNRGKGGSKRSNTASNYLADIVNSYVNAPLEDGDQPIVQAMNYYKNVNNFEKNEIWRNDFFAALSKYSHSPMAFGNSFTFEQLMAVDPNVYNNLTFVDTDPNQLHSRGQTNHWGGSDLSTIAATVLASSVPALMTEQLIGKLIFKSTNDTHDSQPKTDILFGGGFSATIDMRQNFDNFKKIFEIMVLNDITFNNQLPYMLQMEVDLSGQSTIKIKLGNDPYLEYVSPTFCDSLISPVVTSSLNSMLHTVNDLDQLIHYVADATQVSKPINYTGLAI